MLGLTVCVQIQTRTDILCGLFADSESYCISEGSLQGYHHTTAEPLSAAVMNHTHLSLFLSSKTAIIHNLKLMSAYCSPDSV